MTTFRGINEVGIAAHAQFLTGQKAFGTTPVQVVADSQVVQGVVLKAHVDNPGRMYVGADSDVSAATGFPLEPGESVSVPIDNVNKVWVAGAAAGMSVAWIGA